MSEVVAKNSEVHRKCIRTDDGTKLIVNGDEFSRKCEYFKLLFQYETEEEILVHGVSGTIMMTIAEYVEKETLKIDSDNAVALLEACDYLRFADMQRDVLSRLPDFICSMNCLDLANVATVLHLPDLLGLVCAYIATHFPTVVSVSSSNIGDLPLDAFEKVLSDDNLLVSGEDKVLDAIVRWVESDSPNRLKDVPRLLRCIRYRECSDSFIQDLMDLPIVRENEFCSEMRSIIQQQVAKEGKVSCFRSHVLSAMRQGNSMAQSCRYASRKIMISVEPYHCRDRSSCSTRASYERAKSVLINAKFLGVYGSDVVCARKECFFPFYTFGAGNRVYMLNRYRNYVYDMKKDTWTQIRLPLIDLRDWWFVLVEDCVYVSWMNEHGKGSVSLHVATYNPEKNEWFNESSTLVKTSPQGGITDFKAVAIRDCIYIFGRSVPSNEADNGFITARFNTSARSWDEFEAPPIARGVPSISMVAHKEQFFFISDSTCPYEERHDENYKYNFVLGIWEKWPMPPRDPELLDYPTKLRFIVSHGTLFLYEIISWGKEKAGSLMYDMIHPYRKINRNRPRATGADRTAVWRWSSRLATWVKEFGKFWFTMTLDVEDQEDVREMFREKLVEPVWKKAVEEWALKYPVK